MCLKSLKFIPLIPSKYCCKSHKWKNGPHRHGKWKKKSRYFSKLELTWLPRMTRQEMHIYNYLKIYI